MLETLYECAQLEKNQKILGQLGIIRTMLGFFLPMRSGSGAQWNYEILLRVLKIIDSVIKLGPLLSSTFFISRPSSQHS